MTTTKHQCKPLGYMEKIGSCVIKKVSHYGKKYIVYKGQLFYRFADLRKAREFALGMA